MKEKIIIFLIGLLLGATISTGSIYVYSLVDNSNNGQMKNDGRGFLEDNNIHPERENFDFK